MEKIENVLESLWLNPNEVTIYMLWLQWGPSAASNLAKKSGLPRSTVQYTCQSLVKKWVFSLCPKGNSFIFTAEDPEKLQSLLDKQYNNLDSKVRDLQYIMGDLKDMINPHASIPKVKYYQGVDGIIDIFEDILIENKDIFWALDLITKQNKELSTYINNKYKPKRIEKGLKTKRLVSNIDIESYREQDIYENSVSIYVPHTNYPFLCDLAIYWNKVAFFSYPNLTWVVIENEYIQKTIFSLYKCTWNNCTQIEQNKIYKNISL